MSTLRLQADGVCRGPEHALPPVRQTFRRRGRRSAVEAAKATLEIGGSAAAQSLLQRFEGIWNRPRITSVACFDCGTRQELNSAATSTICPSCSVHMDLRDYKINGSFSRAIRTHGEVHVTAARRSEQQQRRLPCPRSSMASCAAVCIAPSERNFAPPAKCRASLSAPEVLIGKKAERAIFPSAPGRLDRDSRSDDRRDRGRNGRHHSQHRIARWQRHRALDQRRKGRHLYRPARHRPAEVWSRRNCSRSWKKRQAAPPQAIGPSAAGHPFGLPATS